MDRSTLREYIKEKMEYYKDVPEVARIYMIVPHPETKEPVTINELIHESLQMRLGCR